jgi:hypothetical protein
LIKICIAQFQAAHQAAPALGLLPLRLTNPLHHLFAWCPTQPIIVGKNGEYQNASNHNTNQIAEQTLLKVHFNGI